MTHYAMTLVLDKWIKPHVDINAWEFYDLSCRSRDDTEDQVLQDAVDAGARVGAIFKEPTITPTAVQQEEMGLKKAWGSPNGAMRRGWNGITISRDTIHIPGIKLGFEEPVFFERHAVGGEYGAGWRPVGKGQLVTTFFPDDESQKVVVVDARKCNDENNVAVIYHNPLDNVPDLAHHFFKRCLEANIVPYVVTKKTVFKWQEGFWTIMKDVFDEHYKEDFRSAGLLDDCGGELQHLISDAATMQIIRWTKGGFGMAAHNYDGDMLTDEVAQVHRSPGFITSNLIGKRDDGTMIKEFEASHGTVADLWHAHLRGEDTSFNPLGMAEAVIGAMNHSAALHDELAISDASTGAEINHFTSALRKAMHATFLKGEGTRDMSGPSGLTTEQFIDRVAGRLEKYLATDPFDADTVEPAQDAVVNAPREFRRNFNVDKTVVKSLFDKYDMDGDGSINRDEFERMVVDLGVAPQTTLPGKEKVDEVAVSVP
uniref:EF-hand domain-containing protein n=1 Tax=Rhizochromulina marina TaxID=1034831 RepID=A0A7S2RKP2_9STRA